MTKDERRKMGGHINILARKLHISGGHVKARWGGRWDKIVINGVVLEVTSEKHGDAKQASTLVKCRFSLEHKLQCHKSDSWSAQR
jgi:hypothetical protein